MHHIIVASSGRQLMKSAQRQNGISNNGGKISALIEKSAASAISIAISLAALSARRSSYRANQ